MNRICPGVEGGGGGGKCPSVQVSKWGKVTGGKCLWGKCSEGTCPVTIVVIIQLYFSFKDHY